MAISVKSTLGFTSMVLALSACVMLANMPVMAQTVIWSGADAVSIANTNWSDANNWTGGTPGPVANICFYDPGANAASGVVDNIVNGNTTILSLQYGNTNNYHTTLINPGVTLAVSNNAAGNLMVIGTLTDNSASQIVDATVTGIGGSLVVVSTNAASVMQIQQGSANSGSHNATLDLAGLGTFHLTAGRLLVGGNPGSSINASNWLSGTLLLANTNVIHLNGTTSPTLDVGDAVNNGATQLVQLGQTNALFIDTITIAHSKATATLQFSPTLAGSNPLLYLRGNSNIRVATLAVGDFSAQSTSGSTTSGTLDLSGGMVDAQVNTCYVGEGQTGDGTGTSTGTLRLGAGTFNVNTLYVGYVSVNAAVGNVTGTVTVTNGSLVVNSNLVLGSNPGATASAFGSLAITNGTVLANNIISGGGTATIAMSGGLLVISNTMGSLTAPLGSLTLRNGATLQFSVASHATNAAVSAISSDNSGVINISSLPAILNYPSQFPLIYCPNGGASGVTFSMGTLPNAFQGFISNDNSSAIWLVVTNGPALPKTDQWGGGVNDNWDTSTLNWTNNGVAVAYAENDLVLFNDSAQTGSVNLAGTAPHTPYAWTVTNNVLNYSFAGTNSLGGPVGLNKSGNASLQLSESGDSFSGGVMVNGGTLILDEPASAISGGLTIASGATVQIGNNDTNGVLPVGMVTDNGALVFSQTITDLVSTAISGGGSLVQNGTGTLELSGPNAYTGNTVVLQGTLALTGSGSLANNANVVVNAARLDVSGAAAATTLGNLNMTNGTLNVGATTVNVSSLNLGGFGNTIKVAALPGILFYPTNIALIQSANGITGYNFALGSLPTGNPAYAGSLSENGNAVVLTLTSGPLAAVQATVAFSASNPGLPLNPAFGGLSYEKSELNGSLFVSNDTALVKMFGQIAPAVLRVGGNSVDRTCWGGLSNTTPITASQVDAFAGFVKALPTNWHVIYGINMSVNNATNCAAEAAYVAHALGSSLLGFEIGNEPDLYHSNGIRPSSYTYAQFLSQWQVLAAAITNTVPGWAITNAGSGWTLTGPASASNTQGYTVPFAGNEAGVISLTTQHYYRANGAATNSTLALLLQPDTSLPGTVSAIVSAATAAKLPLGFRMDECGSFYNGGAPNVSDAYGTALWALDYMFTIALNGGQGVNFHGGGDGTGYTPIADNGTTVVQARPEFYGLKMFSLVSQGSVIPASLTLGSKINFTAYGVRRAGGGISAVLINKETNDYVQASINLGADVTAAQSVVLTGPALNSISGYTIGGAEINADGSWAGGVQSVTAAPNGQLTILLPPISAVLLNPVVQEGTNLLLANDAINTSSWTGSTNWSDGLTPHSGANYFTLTNVLRSPLSGSGLTFGGDSLTIGPSIPGNTSFRLKLNAPGGTYTINNFTNAGGIIDAGTSSATNYLSGGHWFISAPSSFGLSSDNTRAIVLTNLNLSGSATLSNGVANGSGFTPGGVPTNGLGTIIYAGNAANFTGPIVTSLGTTLQAGSQTNLGGNPASFNAAQFVLDNGIFQPLASLALTNSNSGVTLNPGGGTFNVGPSLTLTILNPIAGVGALTNEGGGFLILSGTNTYTGPTMVGSGTLTLSSAASVSSSSSLTIAAGATLNASSIGTLTLPSGQTLAGSGNIAGALTSNPGSTVAPGNTTAIGTLTVSGAVTLSGTTYMKLNPSASTNDVVTGPSIIYGGTLSLTNLTGTLAAGDIFKLFNAPTYHGSFANLTPAIPAIDLGWQTNNLPVNGTISVIAQPTPSPHFGGLMENGNNLIISGTNGVPNWAYYVLASTNLSLPTTNWPVIATNTFDGNGNFSFTNSPGLNAPQTFYLLKLQ